MFQTIRLTSEVGARASGLSTRSNYHGGKQGRGGNPMLKHGRLMAEDNKRVITFISDDIAVESREVSYYSCRTVWALIKSILLPLRYWYSKSPKTKHEDCRRALL